jgi:hypothetical protein
MPFDIAADDTRMTVTSKTSLPIASSACAVQGDQLLITACLLYF